MKKGIDFFGGSLNGRQAGRPRAILLVGEKHQQGRKMKRGVDFFGGGYLSGGLGRWLWENVQKWL